MCSKNIDSSPLASDISKLFHELVKHFFVYDNNSEIDIFTAGVTNKYLHKFKDNTPNKGKYIVFKREVKESYEKRLIGQRIGPDALKEFYDNNIVCDDSSPFEEELFIDEAKAIYNKAFDEAFDKERCSQLKAILNIAGSIRHLFYYRIMGRFPRENDEYIPENDIDRWHEKKNESFIEASFVMLGRYKLNKNINHNGEITSASFYEYLFNDDSNENGTGNEQSKPGTFKAMQEKLYKTDYADLKSKLYELLVNRDGGCIGKVFSDVGEEANKAKWCPSPSTCKGYICFYGSKHQSAGNSVHYNSKEADIFDCLDCQKKSHSDSFGRELTHKLVDRIISDSELRRSLMSLFFGKLVISDRQLPLWGESTSEKRGRLKTGERFKCRIININFLRIIYAHTFDDYKYYYEEFFEKMQWENLESDYFGKVDLGEFKLSTAKDNKPLFDFNVNELPQIFSFFYSDLYKAEIDKYPHLTKDFHIELTGEYKTNLCDEQFFHFIKGVVNKEIFITQTGNINNRRTEIMYLYNKEIMLIDGDKSVSKGKYTFKDDQADTNKVYIVCGTGIVPKDAIIKVLDKVLQKNGSIEFCKAFISAKSVSNIAANEYSDFKSNDFCINQYSRMINEYDKISLEEVSCQGLLKLILARGNNNGKCVCCGKTIDYKSAKLVIVNNDNNVTHQNYPRIYTATCSECRSLLDKCLSSAKISDDSDSLILSCNAQTLTQSKEIVFKSTLSNGNIRLLAALCRG